MLHKFKDFADEDSFEGKKIRIDELLDKDIQVISFKVTPSKHNDGKECTTIQLRVGNVPFVLFTGSFSGMVVINFPKEAAMEIYNTYMKAMTIPENEIATNYTSEEVAGTLGELMNQILGNFTRGMSTTLHSRIQQSQPKMLTLPHEVKISINMALDKPKVNRVTFLTQDNNVFYVEFAMDDTEFTVMEGENESEEASPDDILESVLGNL